MKLTIILVNIALIFISVLSLYESFGTADSIHAAMDQNLGYQAILYFSTFLIGALTQLTSKLKTLGLVTAIVGILGGAYIIYNKMDDSVAKASECMQKHRTETCTNIKDINKS